MTDDGSEAARAELLALARQLYARCATGIVVPYKMLDSNHTEGQCHQNAGIWARDNAGWKVVHGWLVFDFTKHPLLINPFMRFNPHSVVEDSNGTRIDPTPSRASKRYAFVEHDGTPDDFVRIVQGMSLVYIDYHVGKDDIGIAVTHDTP